MDTKKFFDNSKNLTNRCLKLMTSKNDKYNDANGDRLGNFKRAALIKHENPLQAAAGHMSKHTICLYDMIASGNKFSEEQWNEEIMDSLNYLLLLYNILDDCRDDLIADE